MDDKKSVYRSIGLKLVSIVFLLYMLIWSLIENKLTLVYLFLVFLLLALIGTMWGHIWIVINRRRGTYPQKGQETMADVRRLALNGNTMLAINAYRAIKGVNLKAAKKEVGKMTTPAD
ncbi:MAG: hypothetical protein HKP58_03345 [Desulfatitalea sp.]|nr:hypothetical protein [Desulfatitalea sp.]NNJ99427.1 hypothetical protein [Desulfatitalea sp.]